jgi:hypothetical protein
MARLGLSLDGEITLTELREEGTVTERLREYHCVRVRRRNEIIGVLVDADQWRAIEAQASLVEELRERLEEAAVRAIIAERAAGAEFVEGSPQTIAEVAREYERLATSG